VGGEVRLHSLLSRLVGPEPYTPCLVVLVKILVLSMTHMDTLQFAVLFSVTRCRNAHTNHRRIQRS